MENGGLTDRQEAYHNAAINGEAPETLDPRFNTGSFRSPGKSSRKLLASRNTTSAQAGSERPPGRAGFTWWPRYILSRLMLSNPAWHRPRAGGRLPRLEATDCLRSRADRLDAVYLRAAQAYMLISMPTGTSTIFGAFQAIRFSQVY
jgi:hypothetical protein